MVEDIAQLTTASWEESHLPSEQLLSEKTGLTGTMV